MHFVPAKRRKYTIAIKYYSTEFGTLREKAEFVDLACPVDNPSQ
jgi:hypothetical protein